MSGSTVVPSTPLLKETAKTGSTAGGRTDKPLKRLLIHLGLALAALIAFFPILRVFSVAIRPGNKLLDPEFTLIPEGASLEAFRAVLDPAESDLLLWLFNSLAVTIGTSIVGVIIAATSAYAFSRYKFPGRGIGLTTLLATQLIPAAMLLVPIYLLAVQLKLTNSYVGMIIGLSVTAVPFSIWILKGYYDTVPIELEEAARIDGCSQLEAFYRIPPAALDAGPGDHLPVQLPRGLERLLPRPRPALPGEPAHVATGPAAVPAAVPDAVERARGGVDHHLDPGRRAVPLLVEVARLRRDGRRRQGVTGHAGPGHRGRRHAATQWCMTSRHGPKSVSNVSGSTRSRTRTARPAFEMHAGRRDRPAFDPHRRWAMTATAASSAPIAGERPSARPRTSARERAAGIVAPVSGVSSHQRQPASFSRERHSAGVRREARERRSRTTSPFGPRSAAVNRRRAGSSSSAASTGGSIARTCMRIAVTPHESA